MAPNIGLPGSRYIVVVVILLSICQISTQQKACETTEYKCDNGVCIPDSAKRVCDYFDNCGDNSDEKHCTYPPPDKTKALVVTMNSHLGPYSFMQKLIGDPDQYAYKIGNSTFARELAINMNWLYLQAFGFFHAVTTDYQTQTVYYTNHYSQRLEFGFYVHNNSTQNYYYLAVPESNQVTFTNTL